MRREGDFYGFTRQARNMKISGQFDSAANLIISTTHASSPHFAISVSPAFQLDRALSGATFLQALLYAAEDVSLQFKIAHRIAQRL